MNLKENFTGNNNLNINFYFSIADNNKLIKQFDYVFINVNLIWKYYFR